MPPLTSIEQPGTHNEDALASARKLPTLHQFFAPGGVLSRSSLAFEHRKGQYEMARAIEQAFADDDVVFASRQRDVDDGRISHWPRPLRDSPAPHR